MLQNIFKRSWLGILSLFLVATIPTIVQAATKVETSAAIVSLTHSCSGISVTGTGSHQEGIGRVTFVLIDLTKDPTSNLVDSKDIYYSKPLPKQVTESWDSTASLTPSTPYRIAFHIWAKTRPGPQLLVSDLEDFTCK